MLTRKRRISITKLQRRTAAAVELIALCQTITEDGSLTDADIEALKEWLTDNQQAELPAKDFLLLTVTKILADGHVTAEERHELYVAIETALPPDIRADVRGKRTAARAQQRAEREAARAAAQQGRRREAPLGTWDFMVAGCRYEGRPDVIRGYAQPGDSVFLARDPANPFSRNAVEIRLSNGLQIGYVPEEDATEIAPDLDSGHPHRAYIKKILTGGRVPIPVVVATIYAPDTGRSDVVHQHAVPPKQSLPAAAIWPPSGKRALQYIIAVLIALVVIVLGIALLQ
jgi:HIRAN domain